MSSKPNPEATDAIKTLKKHHLAKIPLPIAIKNRGIGELVRAIRQRAAIAGITIDIRLGRQINIDPEYNPAIGQHVQKIANLSRYLIIERTEKCTPTTIIEKNNESRDKALEILGILQSNEPSLELIINQLFTEHTFGDIIRRVIKHAPNHLGFGIDVMILDSSDLKPCEMRVRFIKRLLSADEELQSNNSEGGTAMLEGPLDYNPDEENGYPSANTIEWNGTTGSEYKPDDTGYDFKPVNYEEDE